MKPLSTFLSALFMTFGSALTANATLWDRGGGLIYDDVLNVTWLQDADYASTAGYKDGTGYMTWYVAKKWAEKLRYAGYTDWRLPSALNRDGSGPCEFGNCNGSELGYMYFVNLQNPEKITFPTYIYNGVEYVSLRANDTFTDGNGNTVSIINLISDTYWSGTGAATDPGSAWHFYLGGYGPYYDADGNYHDSGFGYQQAFPKEWKAYAWAVRDGDSRPACKCRGKSCDKEQKRSCKHDHQHQHQHQHHGDGDDD